MDIQGLHPLVDADYLMYRIGFAINDTEPVEFALSTTKRAVNNIWDAFGKKGELFLTGSNNYREHIATIQQYKGNRIQEKPFYYHDIKDYLISVHGAQLVHDMEADDAVGIRQWAKTDRSTCIVGQDKDLRCIPGHHYDPVKEEYFYVTLPEANQFFWTQVLTGDRVDNILGCGVVTSGVYKTGKKKGQPYEKRKGVGPEEAKSIIDATDKSWEQMRDTVLKQYVKLYGDKAQSALHENATLLWIQRREGINYDGEPFNIVIPTMEEMYGSQEESSYQESYREEEQEPNS